jgi:hypothetical protein
MGMGNDTRRWSNKESINRSERLAWVGGRNKDGIIVASGRDTSTSTSTGTSTSTTTQLSLSHSTVAQRHRAPPTPLILDRLHSQHRALSLDQSMPKDPGAR